MADVYLGLGSNLGDRSAQLASARDAVVSLVGEILATSSIYDTAPWGPIPQYNYLNQVLRVSTKLAPRELLLVLHEIEQAAGRNRAREVRYGPRRLDLDILIYGEQVVREEGLTIPHPEIANRAFVLVPLAEIAPDLVVAGSSVRDLLNHVDTAGVQRYDPR